MSPAALVACCLAAVLAVGCAAPPVEMKPSHPYGFEGEDQPYAWHHLRFKWSWPEDERPDWSLDPLIAHMVLSDLIARHQQSLPLWRFHRRAGRDAAGHQFSFIFYSTPGMAQRIEDSARGHAVTQRLVNGDVLEHVRLTEPDESSELLATSDSSWPESVQSTWPMFIMGVSQTWLGLVEIHAGRTAGLEDDLDRAMRRYDEVNDKVDELWSEHAQHAFFHHLSGVFGYEPIELRKRLRF